MVFMVNMNSELFQWNRNKNIRTLGAENGSYLGGKAITNLYLDQKTFILWLLMVVVHENIGTVVLSIRFAILLFCLLQMIIVRWPDQGTPQNFGETILLHFLVDMMVLIKNQDGVEL